jgi:hypothetical protein
MRKPNIVKKDDGVYEVIYTPYITRNGKRIYHPTGGVFRFEVKL